MDSDSSEKQDSLVELPTSIDVKIKFGRPQCYDLELIEGVSVPHLAFNCASEVLLAPLVVYLQSLGFPLQHSIVWYYSSSSKVNVYCGNDPLAYTISVPLFELENNTLFLIFREAVKNEFGTLVAFGHNLARAHHTEVPPQRHLRKTKERKIGYIIEKVTKWRAMYNGLPDSNGGLVKVPLEEAANCVGISKKSLDDYLLQLRFGKRFGFNFLEHKDEKVGVLRTYVRKMKEMQSLITKNEAAELPEHIVKKLAEPGTPQCRNTRCCAPDFANRFKTV